jgi:hypothetical protein
MDTTKNRNSTCISAHNFALKLWRLQDGEFSDLWSRSFPIHLKGSFAYKLRTLEAGDKNELTLPKMLASLEHLYGASSSRMFDSYKGSFAFPFLLEVLRDDQHFYYLFNISDSKGSISFHLDRMIDDQKYCKLGTHSSHEPIESELSTKEIEYLIYYVWSSMKWTVEELLQSPQGIQPFFRSIDAINTIYGFLDGKFFEDYIENTKKYDSAVYRLRNEYPDITTDPLYKLDETKTWIANVTRPICS